MGGGVAPLKTAGGAVTAWRRATASSSKAGGARQCCSRRRRLPSRRGARAAWRSDAPLMARTEGLQSSRAGVDAGAASPLGGEGGHHLGAGARSEGGEGVAAAITRVRGGAGLAKLVQLRPGGGQGQRRAQLLAGGHGARGGCRRGRSKRDRGLRRGAAAGAPTGGPRSQASNGGGAARSQAGSMMSWPRMSWSHSFLAARVRLSPDHWAGSREPSRRKPGRVPETS